MRSKIIIPTILFAIILIFAFAVLSKNKTNNQPVNQQVEQSQIIFFYGSGCPHCAKVEEFIKENKVKEKISFVEKEVYFNKEN